jgi:hypothetical protein
MNYQQKIKKKKSVADERRINKYAFSIVAPFNSTCNAQYLKIRQNQLFMYIKN